MQGHTFTTEESIMIELGLNPGLVENYAEVCIVPVSFEKEESFCWGSRWSAVHEVRYHNGAKLLADGKSFVVTKAKPSFKALLGAWSEKQQGRAE